MKTYYRLETKEPNLVLTLGLTTIVAYFLLINATGFNWQVGVVAIVYFITLFISTQKIERTTKR